MRKRSRMIIVPALVCLVLSLAAGCGKVDRETQESYRQLGLKQLEEGDYASAAESFQKALDESLGSIGSIEVDICYYKALAQYKSGDADAAIETYTALIEYDEENADAYYLRGSAYLACGDYDSCISDYDTAVSLSTGDYELYIGIYENLAEDYEEQALTYLNAALAQECESADDFCGQGYIQYLLGEYETADSLLAAAAEAGSEQAVLYQAQVKIALGDTDAADTLLNTYLEAHPDDADALNEAGMLAVDMGEYDSAITIFTQALSLDGEEDNRELRLNLIYAYEYSSDFDTAYELMLQYAEDFPDDDSIEKELTFLETRAAQEDSSDEETEETAEDT